MGDAKLPAELPAASRVMQLYLPAADRFLCSAQRFLTASAIRLRPSGVRRRFFLPVLALYRLALPLDAPLSSARACCN